MSKDDLGRRLVHHEVRLPHRRVVFPVLRGDLQLVLPFLQVAGAPRRVGTVHRGTTTTTSRRGVPGQQEPPQAAEVHVFLARGPRDADIAENDATEGSLGEVQPGRGEVLNEVETLNFSSTVQLGTHPHFCLNRKIPEGWRRGGFHNRTAALPGLEVVAQQDVVAAFGPKTTRVSAARHYHHHMTLSHT